VVTYNPASGFFRDDYSPANYGTNAQLNTLLFRAIIPRVPRFSLFPFIELIRTSFSLVTVPTGKGIATRTEFGDMQLFDLVVLPWPESKTGLKLGVGPTFIFPTATSKIAGRGAWQAGPAVGAGLHWRCLVLAGLLFQNPISFAYTSPQSPAAEHNGVPANSTRRVLKGLVCEICRFRPGSMVGAVIP